MRSRATFARALAPIATPWHGDTFACHVLPFADIRPSRRPLQVSLARAKYPWKYDDEEEGAADKKKNNKKKKKKK
jgi:hypothetical protein